MNLAFELNGASCTVDVPPMKRLLDVLREDLGVTSVTPRCGQGDCTGCTVLVDGELVRSCLVPAVQLDGEEIITAEGLDLGGALAPLHDALKSCPTHECRLCTPGLLVTARFYLFADAKLPDEHAKEALGGDLHSCPGANAIVTAMNRVMRRGESRRKSVAKKRKKKKASAKKTARRGAPRKSAARISTRKSAARAKKKGSGR